LTFIAALLIVFAAAAPIANAAPRQPPTRPSAPSIAGHWEGVLEIPKQKGAAFAVIKNGNVVHNSKAISASSRVIWPALIICV